MASSTGPLLLNNFIVRIAFQIYAFIETTSRSHLHEIPQEVGLAIEYIHNNYPRSEIATVTATTTSRTSKRSSAEPPDFPPNWATDITSFRRSLRAFNDRTHNYRRLSSLIAYLRQHDPPSTGITPTRPLSLIGNSSAVAITLITLTNTRATFATSATSVEEVIYDRPIELEPRPPLLPQLIMDKTAVRQIVTDAI